MIVNVDWYYKMFTVLSIIEYCLSNSSAETLHLIWWGSSTTSAYYYLFNLFTHDSNFGFYTQKNRQRILDVTTDKHPPLELSSSNRDVLYRTGFIYPDFYYILNYSLYK